MKSDFLTFVKTDSGCNIRGQQYPDIPIFISREGVVVPFSDYMIHLRVRQRKPSGTTETYAYHLQKWQKYLLERRIPWDQVTDSTLIHWRDMQIDVEKLTESTVSGYLQSVFAFYVWAEESGHLKNYVSIYEDYERAYRISAQKIVSGRSISWVWPYLPKATTRPNRHTPTNEEIERIHSGVIRSITGIRDSLILSFYEEGALRRAEALGIKCSAIPTQTEIETARENDQTFTLRIVGKGNRVRHIPILPELMERARDYIEKSREASIRRAKKRNSRYVEPKELFLSHTTGKPLNKQYVSRLISKWMRDVGIERAAGHRIRARGLTNVVRAFDGNNDDGQPISAEMVLLKAADWAGHADPSSLRPYLALARTPGANSDAMQALRGESRVKELSRVIEQKVAAIELLNDLEPVADAIKRGKKGDAQRLLLEAAMHIGNSHNLNVRRKAKRK